MTTRRWQRVLRIVDEVYGDYEKGLVALRRRVVDDMKRKLKEGGVLDRPRAGSALRSAPARKRR